MHSGAIAAIIAARAAEVVEEMAELLDEALIALGSAPEPVTTI